MLWKPNQQSGHGEATRPMTDRSAKRLRFYHPSLSSARYTAGQRMLVTDFEIKDFGFLVSHPHLAEEANGDRANFHGIKLASQIRHKQLETPFIPRWWRLECA